MCRFSGRVEDVSSTKIFARMVSPGRQAIAYAMTLTAMSEVAMILAVPTKPGCGDDAVEFVSLEKHPFFFTRLASGFAQEPTRLRGGSTTLGKETLEVHEVGAFVASFVPRFSDFERLDERFRLPGEVLGDDRDHGFVVFQLKPGANVAVHPMAFTFPTRYPQRLFFPTVHVHDGVQPETAHFDHVLYAQGSGVPETEGFRRRGWFRLFTKRTSPHWETSLPGARWPDLPLVESDRPVHRSTWRGEFENKDVYATA